MPTRSVRAGLARSVEPFPLPRHRQRGPAQYGSKLLGNHETAQQRNVKVGAIQLAGVQLTDLQSMLSGIGLTVGLQAGVNQAMNQVRHA